MKNDDLIMAVILFIIEKYNECLVFILICIL